MEKLNKKGTVGETLEWVIAILIIVFFLFIFIAITTLLVKTKSISNLVKKDIPTNEIGTEKISFVELSAYKSFEGFVFSEVNDRKVYDIIEKANRDNSDADFNKWGKEYLELFFNNKNYGDSSLKVYEASRILDEEYYENYEIDNGSDFKDEESIISYMNFGKNKIVLCFELK